MFTYSKQDLCKYSWTWFFAYICLEVEMLLIYNVWLQPYYNLTGMFQICLSPTFLPTVDNNRLNFILLLFFLPIWYLWIVFHSGFNLHFPNYYWWEGVIYIFLMLILCGFLGIKNIWLSSLHLVFGVPWIKRSSEF